MSKPAKAPSHDELRQRIPWYLNGTLSEVQATEVRQHIRECRQCQSDLVIHEEIRQVVNREETTPIVPANAAASLLNRIPDDESRTGFQVPRFWTAAAAAVTLVTIALLLMSQFGEGQRATNVLYETATSADTRPEMGYVLRVRFEEGIPAEIRARVINELGGEDMRELDDSRTYEMLVQLPGTSLRELEHFANEVKARSEIHDAEFVALQLPVR